MKDTNQQIEITKQYLRKGLSAFTKDELIDAVMRKFDFTTIDGLILACNQSRAIRRCENKASDFDFKVAEYERNVKEYNKLALKAKEIGLQNMSMSEITKMQSLLTKIRDYTKV